jgi:hypothetical protein
VSNARGPDATAPAASDSRGPASPPSRAAQAQAVQKALALVSEKQPAWTRHDLVKQLALVMPAETRGMSPQAAQELLLGLGDQEQLAAVEGGGAMMLVLADRLGHVQLAEPVRFKAE